MSESKGGVARPVPLPDGTYTRPEKAAPETKAEPEVVAKVVEPPAKKPTRKTGGAQTK